jgi:tryptophan synthase alpha subunit
MIHSGADAVITGSALIKKIKVIENKKEVSQELNFFIRDMKKACYSKDYFST